MNQGPVQSHEGAKAGIRPRRLFFALWPDASAAAHLARLALSLAQRLGGRPVPSVKIHLTLVFLGEVAPERMVAVRAAASGLRAKAFDLRLDCLGTFTPACVAWAGTREPGSGLVELQAALAASLRGVGQRLEERAFSPHVTLARRIRVVLPPEAIEPMGWRVCDLRLMSSDVGTGRYSTVESWPLAEGR